jgi:hypothetical protein
MHRLDRSFESRTFPVQSLKAATSYYGLSLAEYVVQTCTSLKEIFRRFDRNSFLVIRSWAK